MKSTFEATKPNEIEFSLTVTMTLKEWVNLKAQMSKDWPSWKLSAAISDMVLEATRTFRPKVTTEAETEG